MHLRLGKRLKIMDLDQFIFYPLTLNVTPRNPLMVSIRSFFAYKLCFTKAYERFRLYLLAFISVSGMALIVDCISEDRKHNQSACLTDGISESY